MDENKKICAKTDVYLCYLLRRRQRMIASLFTLRLDVIVEQTRTTATLNAMRKVEAVNPRQKRRYS